MTKDGDKREWYKVTSSVNGSYITHYVAVYCEFVKWEDMFPNLAEKHGAPFNHEWIEMHESDYTLPLHSSDGTHIIDPAHRSHYWSFARGGHGDDPSRGSDNHATYLEAERELLQVLDDKVKRLSEELARVEQERRELRSGRGHECKQLTVAGRVVID